MEIAILLFDDLTALDAVGPYEVLKLIPEAKVRFVAREPGPKRMNGGSLSLVADCSFHQVQSPEIVLIPGGPGVSSVLSDPPTLDWVRAVHKTSRWMTSVCTGSRILGAAGILRGVKATSHWLTVDSLREYGAEPVHERVVRDGKIITAAGVSAGIDMALTLVGIECGEQRAQAFQLAIEYDPQPPFNAGSPDKAPKGIVELLRSRARTK
ncbi:MAG: DJ-1/PfpI family protein [Candidatus Acidiferrales bacterium]|jgi:transcriptional regulator GlxA family with amidase domain